MKRLIIIANRLPIRAAYDDQKKPTFLEADGGLVSAIKSYIEKGAHTYEEMLWAGSLEKQFQARFQEFQVQRIDNQYEMEAIFIDRNLYNNYYNGFCNSVLWPLFHYFPSYVDMEQTTFAAYEQVNKIFADKIAVIAQPDDTIWIHDYHLMLLPAMLRDKGLQNKIGFFLHIPFPSYELFRLLPKEWREKIMQGLLATDLVGFHTIDYLNHFIKSARFIMGVEEEIGIVSQGERATEANFFPISIDFDKFYAAYNQPDVQAYREAIRSNNPHKKLIFSIDRLDYTKGIINRLNIYEYFLKQHPEYHNKVAFILSLIPSRDEVPKYSEGKRKIEEQISRINGKFGNAIWQPILYQYRQISFEELCAHYTVCDLALITPIRDGMNLVCKEFIAARKDQQGVLILSEMAGAANELPESLLINPNDIVDSSNAILQALTMSPEEQQTRMQRMQDRLQSFTVVDWAAAFLNELEHMSKVEKEDMGNLLLLDDNHTGIIIKQYKVAAKRLLIFDYDGTLREFVGNPQDAIPSPEVLETLDLLANSPQNSVYIVSGRRIEELMNWFQNDQIGLIAEHGSNIKLPGTNEITSRNINQDWKDYVKNILNLYAKRCFGSFVEEKNYSLVWHYRNAPQLEGEFRAKELTNLLYEMLAGRDLQVLPGNKIVEVRVSGVDKGAAVEFVQLADKYDFTLCIGDDTTDEDMFRVLQKEQDYTIKVGQKKVNTQAKYNTPSPATVLSFLQALAKETALQTAESENLMNVE
ncbi:MAG: bifunctional alpha,alpha-trehalose-phosphate synthase (UDP-forming)/trehalose-phosphatase [Saprospiraceae bacterium]